MSLLPGMNCSDTVDTARVVGAHTAPLNVTAIVSLKKHRAQKSVSTKSEVSFNMILKKKKLEQG